MVVHLFLGLTSGVDFTGHVSHSTATLDLPWYQHPAVGLSLMGIVIEHSQWNRRVLRRVVQAYSFYAAAVWPAVVYVVNEDQVDAAESIRST